MVGGPKNIKLLADISFESSLQATVLSSLLLFLCAWRYVDLDDIQWNEVVTSTARNFKNSWPLHLTFSGIINLCPNIWFIKNFKCQQFFHLKKELPKEHKFFIFLRDCYFERGNPIYMNVDLFWETSAGFLKSVVLQLFPKYSQSNVNLNVKSRAKFNCF